MAAEASFPAQIDRLRLRCHRAGRAQYLAAHETGRRHYYYGIPSVIFASLAGTSIFSSTGDVTDKAVTMLAGALAVCSAVLSAFQTFMRYSERSEKYRLAGAEYNALKRRLDLLFLRVNNPGRPAEKDLDELSLLVGDINELEQRAPSVPDKYYDRARKEQDDDIEGV